VVRVNPVCFRGKPRDGRARARDCAVGILPSITVLKAGLSQGDKEGQGGETHRKIKKIRKKTGSQSLWLLFLPELPDLPVNPQNLPDLPDLPDLPVA
jgi:hypothetical protein